MGALKPYTTQKLISTMNTIARALDNEAETAPTPAIQKARAALLRQAADRLEWYRSVWSESFPLVVRQAIVTWLGPAYDDTGRRSHNPDYFSSIVVDELVNIICDVVRRESAT